MKKVYILSGVPGSGKSTHTRKLHTEAVQNRWDYRVVSADHFFEDAEGNYNFDASKIGMAHATCFRNFIEELQKIHTFGSMVVVDNTNLSSWEISPYIAGANAYGYEVEILTVKCDPEVAFARQTHGVPRKSFDNMVRNLEKRWLPPFWKVTEV